jgi:hypothetical protein
MNMYNAQRTNFKPTTPRLAVKPGQQRQVTPRSANRGKAGIPKTPTQAVGTDMIKKLAAFKP